MGSYFLYSFAIVISFSHSFIHDCGVLKAAADIVNKNLSFTKTEFDNTLLDKIVLSKASDKSEVNQRGKEAYAYVTNQSKNSCNNDNSNGSCNYDNDTDEIDFVSDISASNSKSVTEMTSTSITPTLLVSNADDESSGSEITDVTRALTTLAIDNNTISNNSSTKTTVNLNITATDVTTEASNILKYSPSVEFCDCDVTKNECDMNCCCDIDCTFTDRLSFVTCLPVQSMGLVRSVNDYSDHYCYSSQFIYNTDKTVSRFMERNHNGLFCIAIDNLPASLLYENLPPINSIDVFDRKLKRSRKGNFGWFKMHSQIVSGGNHLVIAQFPLNSTEYQYGDFIWTFSNYTDPYLYPLLIPAPRSPSHSPLLPFVESVCVRDQSIRFLKESSYSCLRNIPKSKYDCEKSLVYLNANFYFNKNLRILTAPQTILNQTSLSDYCFDDYCIGLILLVCKDYKLLMCYNEGVTVEPMFNETASICSNIVDTVRYSIYRNGTHDIKKIVLHLHLVNLSTTEWKRGFFRQHFEVKHHSLVYNKSIQGQISTERPFVKSGTPGYMVSKPIITGKKVELLSGFEQENYSSQYVVLNSDRKYWLSLPGVGSSIGGFCDEYFHRNLRFLENMKSECLLQVPYDCDHSRNKTLKILLGDYYSSNVTDVKHLNVYMSSYGDPNPADPDSWVPLLIRKKSASFERKGPKSRERCTDIFTNVDIKILYSYTGTIRRPQAKIVGALMNFYFDNSAVIRIENNSEMLRMRGTVLFIDISKPDDAVIKFAEPPVYEIKLPQDFFYPFLSSSLILVPSLCNIAVIIFLMSFTTLFINKVICI